MSKTYGATGLDLSEQQVGSERGQRQRRQRRQGRQRGGCGHWWRLCMPHPTWLPGALHPELRHCIATLLPNFTPQIVDCAQGGEYGGSVNACTSGGQLDVGLDYAA